ncbi:MAG: methyltransferase domain-containing protein [Myxococcales bacterium]|nr:methyltransferase domain-containing protein [Myxococcales bacterium]
MHARFGAMVLLGSWILACAPTAATPGESTEPPVIDAAGAGEAEAPADADAAGPVGAEAGEVETPTAGAAPQQVELEINQRYEEQTDPEQWASRFEREGREVYDRRDQVLAELGLRPGMAVADVGAGTGMLTIPLAEAVGPEGKVYAVDVQPYFLDHVGQKAREAGLENVELVRAKQDAVGLPPGSIDLAIMVDVYHHVEKPAAYLASIHAALRPEGRLVVIDYRAEEGKSDAWLLEHVRASPDAFRAELQSAGFVMVSTHEGVLEDNFFYELRLR